MKKEAEAKGIQEILSKQAEGFKTIVEAAGGDPDKAVQLMIAEKLPELMRIQADAIQNLKIDKITVWENGGSNGGSSTSNFVQGLLGVLPGYDDLYKMTGKELPKMLGISPSAESQEDLTEESK